MKSFTTFAMFAGLLMFTALGCTEKAETDTPPTGQSEATDGDHDDHDDGDHDHDEDGESADDSASED